MPQLTFDQQEFATMAEFEKLCANAGFRTLDENVGFQQLAIQEAMANCKADIGERIDVMAIDKYPDRVSYYWNLYNNAIQRNNFNLSAFPQFGYINIHGIIVDAKANQTDRPKVFIYGGVPSNGAFNGGAMNGAFLIDNVNQNVYINRGTKEATIWQLFDATGLKDFIQNPTVLKDAFLYGSFYYLIEYQTGKDASQSSANYALLINEEERYEKKYESRIKRALTLLRLDISGDGIISSFDKRMNSIDPVCA